MLWPLECPPFANAQFATSHKFAQVNQALGLRLAVIIATTMPGWYSQPTQPLPLSSLHTIKFAASQLCYRTHTHQC